MKDLILTVVDSLKNSDNATKIVVIAVVAMACIAKPETASKIGTDLLKL